MFNLIDMLVSEDDGSLDRVVSFYERQLEAEHGVLPEDHEVSILLNSILPDDIPVKVLDDASDVNALATPQTIYITRGLLNFIDTFDELEFVLGHEKRHITERHSARDRVARGDFGLKRYHEYRADFGSFLEETDNPHGGLLFFKKLSQLYDQPGIVHGRSTDRHLNMFWTTKLVDIEGLSAISAPLPETIADYARQPIDDRIVADVLSDDLWDARRAEQHIPGLSLQESIYILRALKPRYNIHRRNPHSQHAPVERDILRTAHRNIMKRLWDQGFDNGKAELTAALIATASAGIDYSKDDFKLSDRFYDSLSGMTPERILEITAAENLEALDCAGFYRRPLTDLAGKIADEILADEKFTNGSFDWQSYLEFSKVFADNLSDMYMPGVKIPVYEDIMAEFFRAGLFEFKPDNNVLVEYRDSFLRQTGSGSMNAVFEDINGPYKHLNPVNLTREGYWRVSESVINIIDEPVPPDGILWSEDERKFRTWKKKQQQRIYKAMLGQSSAREGVLRELRNYFHGHQLDVVTLDTVHDHEVRQGFAKHAIQSMLVHEDLADRILAYRAVLPDTNSEVVKGIDERLQAWAGNPNSKKTYAKVKYLFDTMQSDQLLHDKYEFTRQGSSPRYRTQGTNFENVRDAALADELSPDMSLEEKNALMEKYLSTFGKVTANTDTMPKFRWNIVDKVLAGQEWDPSDPEHAKALLYLSFYTPNGAQASKLQSMALDSLLQGSFEDGIGIITSDYVRQNLQSMAPILKFIEEKATTHEHFSRLRKEADSLLAYGEETPELESLVFYENLAEMISTRKSAVEFLSAALESGENDFKLKKMLNSSASIRQLGLEDASQTLYRSSLMQRYALLRNLMTNDQGILKGKRGRRMLYDMLAEKLLDEPETETDKEWHGHVTGIVESFMTDADLESVYFVLVPLMIDRIFKAPKKRASVKSVVEDYILDMWDHQFSDPGDRELHQKSLRGKLTEEELVSHFTTESLESVDWDGEHDCADIENYASVQEQLKEFRDTDENMHSDFRQELKLAYGRGPKYLLKDRRMSRRRVQSKELNEILGKPDRGGSSKMSTLDFIVNAAKNLGAPGVRFLQLLGQYTDVPPEYQDSFNHVYDAIQGQSKFAAYTLLEREWDGFKDEIRDLGETVGGGSLMTVYEAITKDGEREVIKVLNPNAEYHTEESFRVLSEIVKKRARFDSQYELALPLLEDIREWIRADIGFEGFLAKDAEFRETNNGFSHGEYSILVPESKGTDSKYYKREQYVEGINLTHTDELVAQGHDMKEITSLITKSYFNQVMHGRVHSDVHPGNYRVTQDNQVAILDRNFFLELTPEDQGMLYAIANGGTIESKTQAICDYLQTHNDTLPWSAKTRIESELEGESLDAMSDVIKYVKQTGLNMPLRMSLLVKNLFALDNMAKDAGFSDVKEALAYEACPN
ncbi:AarF/UbiB family protein [Nanoarchaeota archaeon]